MSFLLIRSDLDPPLYEKSQVRNNPAEAVPTIISIPTAMRCASPAPPVYMQNSYETSVEDFSHEEPPTYQQAVIWSQADSQAAHLSTNSSVEPL